LSYRDGPLADDVRGASRGLRAGDRAPDAPCTDASRKPRRLFDEFSGTHWTLLLFGACDGAEYARVLAAWNGTLRIVGISGDRAPQPSAAVTSLLDAGGHARHAYAAAGEAAVLVRPDGYIAHFAVPGRAADIDRFMSRVAVQARAVVAEVAL
jgi:hypothetical protein